MTTIRFHTKYSHEDQATLRKAYYGDDTTALLVEAGEPVATCTVSLVAYGEKPADGNVFIKDYGENEGVLQALQDEGVIGPPIREVPCGYAVAYECPLIMEID